MNRTEFYSFYKREILPLLSKYEKERKNLVRAYYCLIFVSGIILICLISICAMFFLSDTPSWGMFLAFIGICAISYLKLMELEIVFKGNIVAKFLIKIKNESLNNILSKFGDLKWRVVANNIYTESIFGTHNGVVFNIIETSDNLIFEFATNKLFKATTFVHSKYDKNIIETVLLLVYYVAFLIIFLYCLLERMDMIVFGLLVIIINVIFIKGAIDSLCSYLKYRKTKLEDTSFNKDYLVKCEDEVEARYFLTTGFMERFKNLQTVFGKKNINCKCENNKITFTIDKKGNPFEIISVFKSFNNPEAMIKLYYEINAIFMMIDYFKLAEDTKI